jgi:hypothetical protein
MDGLPPKSPYSKQFFEYMGLKGINGTTYPFPTTPLGPGIHAIGKTGLILSIPNGGIKLDKVEECEARRERIGELHVCERSDFK